MVDVKSCLCDRVSSNFYNFANWKLADSIFPMHLVKFKQTWYRFCSSFLLITRKCYCGYIVHLVILPIVLTYHFLPTFWLHFNYILQPRLRFHGSSLPVITPFFMGLASSLFTVFSKQRISSGFQQQFPKPFGSIVLFSPIVCIYICLFQYITFVVFAFCHTKLK